MVKYGPKADIEIEMLKDSSLYMGFSYNTYKLEELNKFAKARGGRDIDSGFGIHLGAKRWLDQVDIIQERVPHLAENMGIGIEVDYMRISYKGLYEGIDIGVSNIGLLMTFSYSIWDDVVNANLGLGPYRARMRHSYSGGEKKYVEYTPGVKLGLEVGVPIIFNKLNLNGRGSYRFAEAGDF